MGEGVGVIRKFRNLNISGFGNFQLSTLYRGGGGGNWEIWKFGNLQIRKFPTLYARRRGGGRSVKLFLPGQGHRYRGKPIPARLVKCSFVWIRSGGFRTEERVEGLIGIGPVPGPL